MSTLSHPSDDDQAVPGHQLTVTHWGTYRVTTDNGLLTAVEPLAWDRQPAVRFNSLQGKPENCEGRGKEPFVEVSWEQALTLVASELERVKTQHGNQVIYGGPRLGQGCSAQTCFANSERFYLPLP